MNTINLLILLMVNGRARASSTMRYPSRYHGMLIPYYSNSSACFESMTHAPPTIAPPTNAPQKATIAPRHLLRRQMLRRQLLRRKLLRQQLLRRDLLRRHLLRRQLLRRQLLRRQLLRRQYCSPPKKCPVKFKCSNIAPSPQSTPLKTNAPPT